MVLVVLVTRNKVNRKQNSGISYSLFSLLICLCEFCSCPLYLDFMEECTYKMSSFTSWMALGRVNFIKGTNIKSKQFKRSATCVGICGEINKLLFLDHCSLNALLIWGKKKIKGALEIVCMCMHAHTRENEEKCRDKQKLAMGIFPPQTSEIKLRIISRCQLPQGREMPMEQCKYKVRRKVRLRF